MDLLLATVSVAAMASLAVLATVGLARMLKTIAELRRVTTGLNDTMRWALGRVAMDQPAAHAGAELDAAHAAYDERPLDEPDAWGDLSSFRSAATGS